ncbi:heavy metal translocating P-type ATPase [Desmospora profundinema]|uniref:Cd2+/Zn2+-exporting ATPase n=1 Tax=Desmospora profundinema TaxID=1571184 RepID=A0ABU1IS09_9BACL|nr:heavy metal translocating P-type ATPase [Desmospora profundinema]MDR6227585.1 Cd2+/Zn2+-exporting ATPase [Desmospora profundinema]
MSDWVKRWVMPTWFWASPGEREEDGYLWVRRHGEGIAAGLSGLLILLAWWTSGFTQVTGIVLYLAAYAIGGFAKAREGLTALFTEKKLDVNLLMLVAAMGAASIGYWMEGALLIFIFALSGALERYSEQRSQRDLSALLSLQPQSALLWDGTEEREVPIRVLRPGDRVLVKPGAQLPVDGKVVEGASEVNQSTITGESVPVGKQPGDGVFAGTMNGTGSLVVEMTRPADESTFSKILRLVEEAKGQEPPSQRKIERFEGIYAKTVILVTVLLLLGPPLLWGWSWNDTVYRAMVFLVVASPCAVVASIMPAVLSAMSNGARQGLLFKGGAYVESLSEVRVVAFDKTGTLTRGELAVTDVLPLDGREENEVLMAAASLEILSEHPIARAVVAEAKNRALSPERPDAFQSVTGHGVRGEWRGSRWRIGKPAWILSDVPPDLKRLEADGKTVVALAEGEVPIGLIALRDQIRPEAKRAVQALQRQGMEVVMLTGDRRQTAKAIAQEAGIRKVEAELLPEEKVAAIQRWEREVGPVAMVGDGVNDAPALATARVGIAMGAAGSDVALDTARVVLMNDDLGKVSEAIALGRRTWRIVKQNLVFALAVIGLLIMANFTNGISLPLGVIGHEGSTLLVIVNGLRLLR